ncbi:MAG TPA: CocE/NonD family hydrolase, partial [Microlunatus sp.]|nr:CocE/NonD family hydrolase [Microlunatus sp.]
MTTTREATILFGPGNPPEAAGWPGGDYSDETVGDLRIQRNVAVPMRDGLRLLVDLYQPAGTTEATPVLVAWSPYGKHGALDWSNWSGHEVDLDALSPYVAFETPDPAYWAGQGYSLILADARGAWGSEGDVTLFDRADTEACYDLIEWAGTQDWSNGKVGMAGVSWYAIIQWAVAALRPPHLAAINPWEGLSDPYYEMATHGGIPETQFSTLLGPLIANTHGRVEDVGGNAMNHPFHDEYWKGKVADHSAIDVPAYVVASWSDHGLHTRGTLEAFRKLSSTHKWLEVHGRKKWSYFYAPDSVARQTAFFDRFLKDEPTEVDDWPPVRLEVRERANVGTFRDEQEWPLARTRHTPLYLDARAGSLAAELPAEEGEAAYDATGGQAVFDHVFDADTELTGYMKLRLWVEAEGADNMDLFVGVQKLNADGERVPFPFFSTFDDGDVALGWLRVSRRELDESASTPQQPVYLHQKDDLLSPGEVVPVEIEIWPSATLFRAEEALRLVVQGHDLRVY